MSERCRRETVRTVLALEPSRRLPKVLERADDITWAWLQGRCATCGACPSMLKLFDVSPAEAGTIRRAFPKPKLRLVA